MKKLYLKSLVYENILNHCFHETYLNKLLTTYLLLEISAPLSICDALRPIRATLIHRNGGSIAKLSNNKINL